jgi:hypothetical protein
MLRRIVISSCAVLGLAATSFGQVTLEQKLTEGANYTTETSVKTEQKLTIAGMNVDTLGDVRTVSKSTVGKRDVEGKVRVQEKVESLQTSMTLMGLEYSFDSANPDEKGSSPLEFLRDVHKGMAKRTMTTIYDKSNRAVAVESDQDVLGSLPEQAKALVKSSLDPTNLKNTVNDELDQLKREPVKPGDTWRRTRASNLGGGQVMTFDTEFTYAGTVEKGGRTLDKITSKTLSVSFAFEDSPLPIVLKSSDLKVPESEGAILFDRETGQTIESNSSIRITGDLIFTANGMELPSKLDLKLQTTTVVKP